MSVYGTFTHKGHPCLIYELLDFSLKELQYRFDQLEVLLGSNNNNNQTDLAHSKSTNKKAESSSAANQESSKGLSLFLIQSLYRDLLKCLQHIHQCGWVHADLKPANVMWSAQEGVWKVVDFGHSFEENNQVWITSFHFGLKLSLVYMFLHDSFMYPFCCDSTDLDTRSILWLLMGQPV